MPALPKLKVTNWSSGSPVVEMMEFERAKEFLDFNPAISVKVEGETLVVFEELVRMAQQSRFKGCEFLEVEIVPLISGG